MSFLDIKDPSERATLGKEYVTAMKTAKQRNMANRKLKLAIRDELQTLFHPLTAQRVDATPPLDKSVDTIFGVYRRQDGQLIMGSKIVQADMNKKTLTADGTVYDFTPGLHELIVRKTPHPS